jgi:hypothetical protein
MTQVKNENDANLEWTGPAIRTRALTGLKRGALLMAIVCTLCAMTSDLRSAGILHARFPAYDRTPLLIELIALAFLGGVPLFAVLGAVEPAIRTPRRGVMLGVAMSALSLIARWLVIDSLSWEANWNRALALVICGGLAGYVYATRKRDTQAEGSAS